MKTLFSVLGLTFALTLALGCGGDSDTSKDKGVVLPDSGGKLDTGGGQLDTGGGQLDTGGGQLDTGGGPTGANSGQTCEPGGTACPTGDTCLGLTGWAKGMCFGGCAKQGDPCSTADATKYLSQCALTDATQTQWYCLYICEVQGQTYECPDPATQDCIDSTTAGVKICKPK